MKINCKSKKTKCDVKYYKEHTTLWAIISTVVTVLIYFGLNMLLLKTDEYFYVLAGVVIALLVSLLLKCIVYTVTKCIAQKHRCSSKNKYKYYDFPAREHHIFNVIFYALSWDYAITDVRKKLIVQHLKKDPRNIDEFNVSSEVKRDYIIGSNLANIACSLLIAILTNCISAKCCCGDLVRTVLFSRLLSRTIEINGAFMMDVMSEEKSSSIKRGQRIVLAILSLIEEVFLFGGFYYLFLKPDSTSILYGLYTLAMQMASFKCSKHDATKWVALYQALCSLILISLAIANYLSSSDNNKKIIVQKQNEIYFDTTSKGIEYQVQNTHVIITRIPSIIRVLDLRNVMSEIDKHYVLLNGSKLGSKTIRHHAELNCGQAISKTSRLKKVFMIESVVIRGKFKDGITLYMYDINFNKRYNN